MTTDTDPVADDEFVYRLIAPPFFNPATPVPVLPLAFRPIDRGEDGISVIRAVFATPEQAVAAVPDPARRPQYRVARRAVADLAALGLTIRPDPLPSLPGHAIIPELNTADYGADRACRKGVLAKLAALAAADIVLAPQP